MSRHPQVFISTAVLTMVLSLCLIAAERPSVLYAAGDFIVTTTQDIDGTTCGATCSLRQAINAANASGGGTVKFNLSPVSNPPEVVPGGNAWRITLSSGLGGLPALEAGTDVDGTSQGVARPSQANLLGPEIIIDGTNVPGRSGITIASVGAASEVKGLSIINFNSSGGFAQGVGINVTAGSGHILRGNFVGVEANGSTVGGNGFAGIWVQSLASNVTIGGDVGDTQQVNVVSGNDLDGILLQGNGNTVQGNYIGTNFRGSVAVPNQGAGIRVYSSNDNVIGPKDGQEIFQNIIAGNRDYGIVIDGGRNTEVAGNYIGLGINQVSGINDIALPNVRGGVEVNSDARAASGNKVGVAGRPRNFISANTGPGVRIRGTTTTTTRVSNNVIGLNGDGFPILSPNNTGGGVVVSGASGVTIGGPTFDETNVISANGGDGIFISGTSASARSTGTTIQSNCVGTGTACIYNQTIPSAWANARAGVALGNYVHQTTIGGTGEAANVIAYNLGYGIAITGTGVLTTTVAGNEVRFNGLDGIFASGAGNTQIAGQDGDGAVVVSQNLGSGVRLASASLSSLQFVTLANNTQDGVQIADSSRTTLQNLTLDDNGGDGVQITDSLTNTLQTLTVTRNDGNGVLLGGVLRDTTVSGNQVLTNTLGGIVGTGAWRGTALDGNTVRGQGQAGINLSGASQLTAITGNTIQLNGHEGIRVDGGSDTEISGNTVISNTQAVLPPSGTALGGVVVNGTTRATVGSNTVQLHAGRPGILLGGANNTLLESNDSTRNGTGIEVTDGVSTTVRSNLLNRNTLHGLLASGTTTLTVTQQTQLSFNGGSGVRVIGASSDVAIIDTQVYSNSVSGIQLGEGGSGLFPQQVTILDNKITGNGIPVDANGAPTVPLPVASSLLGRGIVFDPDPAAGTVTNPNHDIDPPLSLAITTGGQLTGQVNISGAAQACTPATSCRVQVFRANRATQDGQGRDKLGEALVSASGQFTLSLGLLPTQLALTATDAAGNTSRFGLFTPAASVEIGLPRSVTASPGEVVTYTHRVTNTGNIELPNLQLSAASSRGWNQIALTPSGQFTLRPGASRLITVSVTLPSGSDPRVTATGPSSPADLLTVTVSGSYRRESDTADQTVRAQVVNTTTVLPKVVLALTPGNQSGRGLPGSVLPYVHTLRNNGNIPATVSIAASTDLGPSWSTQVTPNGQVMLQPGQQQVVQVLVTVPARSTGVTSGTVALTTLAITTVTPADATQNLTITDTTTVTLDQAATVVGDAVVDGAADVVSTFEHRVTNLSNGRATFRLMYSSSLGSTVTFRSATTGVMLSGVGSNTFTLGTTSDDTPPDQLTFFAEVKVNHKALPGQKDSIIIYLVDDKGNVVGGAFVRDTVNVVRGTIAPRIVLPWVGR